jgi:peptidoglycan/LPS O-acetylase OafA/YrhL
MAEASRTTRERYYPALDGLRGLAILAVFLLHYGGGAKSKQPIIHFFGEFTRAGGLGVDLFFVLSGFLITGILLDTVEDHRYYRVFYMRRILRIFPLYYGVLLGLLLLTHFLHINWQTGHLLLFLYLNNLATSIQPSLNDLGPYILVGHFWSLAVEEQFYLVWPWLLRLCRNNAALVALFAACIVSALLFRWAVVQWGLPLSVAYYQLPSCMDRLAIGGLLAAGVRRFGLLGISRRLPLIVFLTCSGAVAVCYARIVFMATLVPSLVGAGAASLVWMALWHDSICARIFSLTPLRVLGKYSYGLYVYHQMLKIPFDHIRDWMGTHFGSATWTGALYIVLALLANLGIAVASYHLFEIHFLRMKGHFAYGEKSPPEQRVFLSTESEILK